MVLTRRRRAMKGEEMRGTVALGDNAGVGFSPDHRSRFRAAETAPRGENGGDLLPLYRKLPKRRTTGVYAGARTAVPPPPSSPAASRLERGAQ